MNQNLYVYIIVHCPLGSSRSSTKRWQTQTHPVSLPDPLGDFRSIPWYPLTTHYTLQNKPTNFRSAVYYPKCILLHLISFPWNFKSNFSQVRKNISIQQISLLLGPCAYMYSIQMCRNFPLRKSMYYSNNNIHVPWKNHEILMTSWQYQ